MDLEGETGPDATHARRTDPEARLYGNADGQPSRLCQRGRALAEDRHGLIMAVSVTASA